MNKVLLSTLAIVALLVLVPLSAHAQNIITASPIKVDMTGPNVVDCAPYVNYAEWYLQKSAYYVNYVNKYLKHIQCVPTDTSTRDGYGHIDVWSASFVSAKKGYSTSTPTFYASAIVHEACHERQFQTSFWSYFFTSDKPREYECSQEQIKFLQDIGGPQAEIDYLNRLITDPSLYWGW